MIRGHPGAAGFIVGLLAGALFVMVRPTGPDVLLAALQLLVSAVPIGLGLLLLSWFLSHRGVAGAQPIAKAAGLWVGFVVGFYALGILTCAFCLS